ncbi:hypothetical protein [Rheinheimera sp. MMS21-TC3]|uniref:hypothetical protein n=1 Tax=Rheinheimera sp. MMS21-TC3 TaxID=3072790 RepID=UPI0028C38C72|nr:hypothetical protein [Rheinheimera sp. MMS21-TC3]WNO59749.1 hypothetical protein RDV63_01965 [Rheinheimera sp. MMS21-TC3]
MKLNLKKKELVNLSHDNKVLPKELTPEVAGGTWDPSNTRAECRTRSLEPGETCGQRLRGCVPVF